MSTAEHIAPCVPEASPAGDPFTSLAVHFGMLLGVADFHVLTAHAWSKVRLHNRWLHGAGAVWGLGLAWDAAGQEIRVAPGLALDAAGHELHVGVEHCVDLPGWAIEHRADLGGDLTRPFDLAVVASFEACAARPVPAMAPPCEGAEGSVSCSRLVETAVLELVPDAGDAPPPPRYPRLARLAGLPVPDDTGLDDVDAARARVAAEPDPVRQAELRVAELRTLAALDAIGIEGPLFGVDDSPPVLLGVFRGITVDEAARTAAVPSGPDYTGRRTHVTGVDLAELLLAEKVS